MNYSWVSVIILLLIGNMLISFFGTILMALIIHIGVLIGSYFILRRNPFIDVRASMLFLLGMTVINVLSDLRIMTGWMTNLAFIALVIWSAAGGGRSR